MLLSNFPVLIADGYFPGLIADGYFLKYNLTTYIVVN
jgi:hypothetical protein